MTTDEATNERKYEVLDEAEFDFSLENFRDIGFQFRGRVTTAEVRAIPEATFERKDGSGSFTRPAHNQLVIWATPLDIPSAKGDYKIIDVEYKSTLNKRSILGRFVEEASKAGVKFRKPSELLGRVFEFERLEGVKFGKLEASPFFVIRAEDKGAAGVTSSPASSQTLSDENAAALAQVLNGVENTTTALISAVSASPLRTESKVMAAVASGQALRELQSRGLVRAEGSTLVLV